MISQHPAKKPVGASFVQPDHCRLNESRLGAFVLFESSGIVR
jgi:hypothetical protein